MDGVGFSRGAPVRRGEFPTTHWSVVLQVGSGDSPHAAAALEQLCRDYWYPVYAFVRRRGYRPEDAQDLTQEFFCRLLTKHWFDQADRGRGRFRSFLLASLEHFLTDEWHKVRTEKRGGGQPLLPLDWAAEEARYRREPADQLDAERLYERRWALTLLDRVLERLRQERGAGDERDTFDQVLPLLVGERGGRTYADVARRLGTTEGALKMTVHRLRQRYRELMRDEIAQTVTTPEEIAEEMHYLRMLLRR